jgi:hypothetical protein
MERYFSIRIKNWREVHFKPARAYASVVVLIMICFLLNIHIVFTYTFPPHEPPYNSSACLYSTAASIWFLISPILYSLVPVALIAVFNSLLIYKAVVERKRLSAFSLVDAGKRRAMTVSVVTITSVYAILGTPYLIIGLPMTISFSESLVGRVVLLVIIELTLTTYGKQL